MPQARLSVRKIYEVLCLKFERKLSNRAIARTCSISPSTVCEYITRAEAAGLSWPLPEEVDEDHMHKPLFPNQTAHHRKPFYFPTGRKSMPNFARKA